MDRLAKYYKMIMDKADDRVADWFLMSSPVPTVAVVMLYLIVITQGRKLMRDYKPFDLKGIIMVYNFCLVVLSAYMVYELIASSWMAPGFSLACQAMDYSDNLYSLRLAKVIWWFYFSKIIELMDTVFFVLRKKDSQISFLHVYHHTTMPLLWWVGIKFVGGGEAFFSATINSGIHVLMYLYYLLSAMGPSMQPYLWWKKYMTSLQLIQFWMVLFKTAYAVYLSCGYPVEYGYALVAYMVSHIILFSNFYYQTYHKQARHKKNEDMKLTEANKSLLNNNKENIIHNTYSNGVTANNDVGRRSRKTKRLD